ncbi:MAG: sulfatase [Pseudomonadota bacterium]
MIASQAARFALAVFVVYAVLLMPNHPASLGWGIWRVFPLELPLIVLTCVAVGGSFLSTPLRLAIAFFLTVMVALKGADFVNYNALSRPFNPVADMALVEAFVRLLVGSFGSFLTGVIVVLSVVAVAGLIWLIWWSTGVFASLNLGSSPTTKWIAAAAAMVTAGVAIADTGRTMRVFDLATNPPGAALTSRIALERAQLVGKTLAQARQFRTAAANDSFDLASGQKTTVRRDVLVIFVESYGRASFDTPQYANLHRQTLNTYAARLRDQELAMRSGFLASPTKGGQSWLAHATLANGLWIDNQISYAAALSSGRQTLFHHGQRAGFRTATVMPQITLAWPESARMGFERVLVAKDLGYRGLPFNWVTMPDQFTLSASDRLLRGGNDPRPLLAQIALASSHAPWVPIPEIIPWADIGDGTVFNAIAQSGDPPNVVWRDRDRVRAQYRLAINYALKAVLEYGLLHAKDPPLMIVVGDHQAAGFVALDERRDVPIHIIGPEDLVERLSELAPFTGLVPPKDATALPMDKVRDMVLQALVQPSQRNADP